MDWIMELGIALCMVIVVGGITFYFAVGKTVLKINQEEEKQRKVHARMDALERRLADLQEIVLSLDERAGKARPARTPEPTPVQME